MNEYQDFSSLPPQQEQAFVPFERQSRASAKTAKLVGLLVGGGFLALILIVVATSPKRENQHAKDLEQDELSVEKDRVEAERPAVAPPTRPATAPEAAPVPGEATPTGAAPAPEAPPSAPAPGAAAPAEAVPAAAPAAAPAQPAPKSE